MGNLLWFLLGLASGVGLTTGWTRYGYPWVSAKLAAIKAKL